MSGSAYNGIDVLMEAEKEASAIIQEARQSKCLGLLTYVFLQHFSETVCHV